MNKGAAFTLVSLLACGLQAQDVEGLKQRPPEQTAGYKVAAGTHILLTMINSVSTKVAQPGDRIYLETAFPVFVDGRLVIPQGSWVTGTVTEVKRPKRMKGRSELRVRFDTLMLPNGITRPFHPELSQVDQRQNETLNRETGKITASPDKKDEVGVAAGTTAAGAGLGTGIGLGSGHPVQGALIGAGAGAAAGILCIMLAHGPDAMLPRGSTVEMVLDRPLHFDDADLDFSKSSPAVPTPAGAPPQPAAHNRGFTRIP
jgi:hypothetical protein